MLVYQEQSTTEHHWWSHPERRPQSTGPYKGAHCASEDSPAHKPQARRNQTMSAIVAMIKRFSLHRFVFKHITGIWSNLCLTTRSGYLRIGSRQLLKDCVIRWLAVMTAPICVIVKGVVDHQRTWIPQKQAWDRETPWFTLNHQSANTQHCTYNASRH